MNTPEDNSPSSVPESSAAPEAPEASPVAASPAEPLPQVPEDLRVEWTWTDLLIFFVFALGIGIVVDYVLVSLAVLGGYLKATQVQSAGSSTVYIAIRQTVWFTLMMVFLFFTLKPRSARPFWEILGWREARVGDVPRKLFYALCLVSGIVLAIAVAYASQYVAPKEALPIQALFRDRQSVVLLAVIGICVAPIVEESVFRGFLYPVVARSWGMVPGIVVTGILFGMMHAPQLWGGWGQIVLLMLVGVVFTAARARTGSVTTSFFLHVGYNAILFLGFFFSEEFHKLPLVR